MRHGRNMAMRLLRVITARRMLRVTWITHRSNECAKVHWHCIVASALAERGLHTYTQAQFDAERAYLASM